MEHSIIYHVCTSQSWEDQLESSVYKHDSIEKEGFIHCSNEDQVEGVLIRYFKGVKNLLLLTIQSEKVNPRIQYEKAPNGDDFPHIFGPLNKDAILKISKILN